MVSNNKYVHVKKKKGKIEVVIKKKNLLLSNEKSISL